MRYILLFRLLMLVMVSSSVIADPWHEYTNIEQLYPSFDGYYFIVGTPLTSQSACDNGKRFHIKLDHPNYDALVSSLMFAHATGKKIRMNIDGNSTPQCSASVNRFTIEK